MPRCGFFVALLAIALSISAPTVLAELPAPPEVLLFCYFRDNGKDGVFLATSDDGAEFRPLNDDKPVFSPPKWPGQNLTRDPSILYHNGVFHSTAMPAYYGNIKVELIGGINPAAGDVTAQMEVDLGKPASFNLVCLQEPVFMGQRVKKYRFGYWDGTAWRTLSEGTTIGHRKLDRVAPVTAQKVRLTIEDARACPLISTFGLHLTPFSEKESQEKKTGTA